MRRIIAVFAAVAALLTGCSPERIQDRAYLRSAAVDSGKVTFEFFEGEPMTVPAEDLAEALREAELASGRKIYTGYTELIVLGNCPAKSVLGEMLTVWRVSPECIVLGSSGSAGELLTEATGELLEGSAKLAAGRGDSPESGIITVLSQLLSEKNTAELPLADSRGVCGKITICGD
ncbi:MAG TPA: hypothetical protein PLY43_02255 [Ruminococcus sp.]|nr:hypothetical protein [Ruminococcus sp.]HOR21525.1 hypothetical protein [Ruminococcus sp.]